MSFEAISGLDLPSGSNLIIESGSLSILTGNTNLINSPVISSGSVSVASGTGLLLRGNPTTPLVVQLSDNSTNVNALYRSSDTFFKLGASDNGSNVTVGLYGQNT